MLPEISILKFSNGNRQMDLIPRGIMERNFYADFDLAFIPDLYYFLPGISFLGFFRPNKPA